MNQFDKKLRTVKRNYTDTGLREFNTMRFAAAALLAFLPTAASATTYGYTIVDLPGAFQTKVTGINNAGQIVGTADGITGFSNLTGTLAAYPPPFTTRFGSSSSLLGVNNSGTVLGAYRAGATSQTQFYVGATPATTEYIDTSVRRGFTFGGINDSGSYVTNSFDLQNNAHSYLRIGTRQFEITYPGAQSINAADINTKGEILGSIFNGVQNIPFVLTGATFTTPTLGLFPVAFNASDTFVGNIGGSGNFGIEGGVQSGTTLLTLDAPGSGGYLGTQHATYVTDINDGGTVVGYFFDNTNLYHGFIATPVTENAAVPAPGSGALVLAVLALIGVGRRTRNAASA